MAHHLKDLTVDPPFLVVQEGKQALVLDHIERVQARFEGQCSIVTSSGFELKVDAPAQQVVEWLRDWFRIIK